MKMIYHQRDKHRRQQKFMWLLIWIVIFIFVISILSFFIPHLFTPILQLVGRPFFNSRAGVTASVDSSFNFLTSKDSLTKDNSDLRNQLIFYNAVKTERDKYKLENIELQKMLGKVPATHRVVLGRILSKPGFSPYDTVIIDSGSKDGIAINQIALADDSTIIGFIGSVSNSTANIILYSSPEQKINVIIGTKALQAIAVGKGGGNYSIKLPKNAGVLVGDIVSLASNPEKIIGTIAVIGANSTDSFEDILFKSPIDVNQLQYLLVEIQ